MRDKELLLGSQGPMVLCLADHLVFLDHILGMPAGMRVRESVVQTVAPHTLIERAITHAVAPRKSLVELYLADIEEDRAEALVCYAFVIAEENTATGRPRLTATVSTNFMRSPSAFTST